MLETLWANALSVEDHVSGAALRHAQGASCQGLIHQRTQPEKASRRSPRGQPAAKTMGTGALHSRARKPLCVMRVQLGCVQCGRRFIRILRTAAARASPVLRSRLVVSIQGCLGVRAAAHVGGGCRAGARLLEGAWL